MAVALPMYLRPGFAGAADFEIPAPSAASSSQEFQIESGTGVICLLVPF
jgi:hypothetical protein